MFEISFSISDSSLAGGSAEEQEEQNAGGSPEEQEEQKMKVNMIYPDWLHLG